MQNNGGLRVSGRCERQIYSVLIESSIEKQTSSVRVPPRSQGSIMFSIRYFAIWLGVAVLLNTPQQELSAQPSPSIIQQPTNQVRVVGTSARFSVTATGQSLAYYWLFNGNYLSDGGQISGVNTASLLFSGTTGANAGNYQVIVSNKHGVVTSETASLTLLFPPIVTEQPSAQSVILGSNLTLTATSTGTAPLTFQWRKNGTNLVNDLRISGADSNSINISAVTVADAGLYSVNVSNVAGQTNSETAAITILVPPSITQQPVGRDEVVGSNVIFTVSAAGDSPLSYQWSVNGTNLADDVRISGATTPSLNLSNITVFHAGAYLVQISNGVGSVTSEAAILNVLVPPAITQQPTPQVVILGSNLTLSVSAVGTAPLHYQWQKDGTNLVEDGRIMGVTSNLLSIASVAVEEGGNYSVTVTNLAGQANSDLALVTVAIPPSVVQQPVSQSQISGSNIVFTVQATGDNPLAYQWSLNGTNLIDDARIEGALTSSLSISNLNPSDAGNYRVRVSNAAGSAMSEVATLNILVPPAIVQQPFSQIVVRSNTFSLAASASGTEPMSYEWFFNDAPVANGGRISGADTPQIFISTTQTNDAGNYFLVASNRAGIATSEVATITVVVPPSITESPASRSVVIGSNTVFAVTVTGTEPFGFQWYNNTTKLLDDTRRSGSTSNILSISNVQTSDAGSYYLAVTNAGGSVTSSFAALTIFQPPQVIVQPRSRSVVIGLPTTFEAIASGGLPLAYQWYFNNAPISGATANTFSISAVNSNHFGNYHLVISNAAGVTSSAPVVLTYGLVAAWGRNTSGQCVVSPDLTNAFVVAGNTGSSLAVRSDGTPVNWGSGTTPLGSNYVGLSASPSAGSTFLRSDGTVAHFGQYNFLTSTNVVAVVSGNNFVMTLRREGVVHGSGFGANTNIPSGLKNVSAIAAGSSHVLALLSNGTVVAWGSSPGTNVPAGLKDVVAVAGGYSHSLALKSDGRLVAWGTGEAATIPPGLSNVTAIAVGANIDGPNHNLALLSNGTVIAWGNNAYSQTNVPPGLTNVVALAGAPYHSLAIVGDGRPLLLRPPVGGRAYEGSDFELSGVAVGTPPLHYQWLRNGTNIPGATASSLLLTNIQVGRDAMNYQLVVSNVFGTLRSVVAPVQGSGDRPRLLSWSTNLNVVYGSKLLIDPVITGSLPMQFQWRFNGTNIVGATNRSLNIGPVRHSNAGIYTVVVTNYLAGITSPPVTSPPVNVQVIGPIFAWGSASFGVTNVPPDLTNVVAISSAPARNLALRADGTVVSWGTGYNGNTNLPPGLSNIVEIATGTSYGAALRKDGTVIGLWNASQSLFSRLTNVVSIEADAYGIGFLHTNGTVTRVLNGSVPASATNILAMAPFDDGHFGIRADATFYYAGSGSFPPTTNGVMAIASARYHGLLLRQDGSLVGWGTPAISNSVSNVISVASSAWAKWAVTGEGRVVRVSASSGDSTTNMPGTVSGISVIDAGNDHILALATTRDLSAVTLSQATDNTNLVLSSKGAPQWYAQTNSTHDGVDAVRSAEIERDTASSMRMFVTGPVSMRFWWKVSSQTNSDLLTFSAAGVPLASISGEVGWQQRTINVPPGRQILVWTYSKDSTGTSGLDAGWVDQIEVMPSPPVFVTHPLSRQALSGASVSFSASVTGTAPISYLWYKNGAAQPASTTSSLTILGVTRNHSGTYQLRATNVAGVAFSSNAVLKVISPQVMQAPSFVGGVLQITSADSGGTALSQANLSSFEAQFSTNLLNWLPLPESLSISNGSLYLRDLEYTNAPQRFYRVIESW